MKNLSPALSNNKFLNNLALFIVVIMFNLICFSNMNSQVTLCYPDCLNDLWNPLPPSPAFTHTVTLPCGEPVIIHYRTRFACGNLWDIFIEKIEFVNGYGGGQNCGMTMTVTEMIQAAMNMLIYDNPMNYPPTDSTRDTCVTNWRVMVGGCWHPSFPVGPGDSKNSSELPPIIDAPLGLLIPCVFIECCIKSVIVCFVSGKKVIIDDPQNSYPGWCDYRYQPNSFPAREYY
ncbi:MAG: hypothetical protein HZB41_03385 [Ignavibacteriae bacterium]|nr:hypothetical protein [Ignavibacteriota bacterium]